MTITIRIDPQLQAELDRLARLEGVSRSDVVRESLVCYLAEKKESVTPWELGKDVFGRYASGRTDLSAERKKILKEKLRAKKNRS
jgi:RHH-type rel operon transcriptional repressor/antitoxin RelB